MRRTSVGRAAIYRPAPRPMKLSELSPTALLSGFLILLVIVQFGYPVTYYGTGWVLAYQIAYASLLIAASYATRTPLSNSWTSVVSGVLFLGASVYYAYEPASLRGTVIAYLALIPFQATLIKRLWNYVDQRDEDALPDILAAVCIYLLLGAIFVPMYGLLETLEPHSFADAGREGHVTEWQQFVYYSYVTLNTVGFGDIRPVGNWARSLSNLEAMCGVLYIAILISQLVARVRDRERMQTMAELREESEEQGEHVPEVLQEEVG